MQIFNWMFLYYLKDSVNANHCNDALTSMYMNKSNNPVTSTNDGVLIDISSDESDSDEANNLKLSKGNNKSSPLQSSVCFP